MVVIAPANNDAIFSQTASMIGTTAYRRETLIFRCLSHAAGIASPADGYAIAAQAAGMEVSTGYGYEFFVLRR